MDLRKDHKDYKDHKDILPLGRWEGKEASAYDIIDVTICTVTMSWGVKIVYSIFNSRNCVESNVTHSLSFHSDQLKIKI